MMKKYSSVERVIGSPRSGVAPYSEKDVMTQTCIHASAVVDTNAVLEEGVVIGPHCVIEAGARIGAGTVLEVGAVVRSAVVIGRENHLHAYCVVGDTPQVLGRGMEGETGGLVMGDHNVVREHVTLHRSLYPGKATQIGNHNLFMVASHVGHDCLIEDQIVLCNTCLLGGHCKVETGAWMSGMAACHQFVTLGQWVYVAAKAAITRDVPPFLVIGGTYPARIRGVNERGLKRGGAR